MNRLLFAAARGARIEARAQTADGDTWYGAAGIVLKKDSRTLRIHPDDASLEYGPVSSALREMAETEQPPTINIEGCGITLWVQENEAEWLCASLAVSLADVRGTG